MVFLWGKKAYDLYFCIQAELVMETEEPSYKARMMGTPQERPEVPRDGMPDRELVDLRQGNAKDRWVRSQDPKGTEGAERRPHCPEGNRAFACNLWHFMHSNLNLKENHQECSVGNISVSFVDPV